MKLFHTVKLSHEQFGSKSWTVELEPKDVGLQDPTSQVTAYETWIQMSARAVEMVEGNMVKEGIMTEAEFNQTKTALVEGDS